VDLNYSACSSATFVFGRFPSMCVRPLCGTERFATAAGAELVVRRPERPRLVALTGILCFFSSRVTGSGQQIRAVSGSLYNSRNVVHRVHTRPVERHPAADPALWNSIQAWSSIRAGKLSSPRVPRKQGRVQKRRGSFFVLPTLAREDGSRSSRSFEAASACFRP